MQLEISKNPSFFYRYESEITVLQQIATVEFAYQMNLTDSSGVLGKVLGLEDVFEDTF